MDVPKGKGSLELQNEVMNAGMCTACGLCVGMCPYIKTAGERVAVIYPCGLAEGDCYKICPRTPADLADLDRHVFGAERDDHVLGNHAGLFWARAADPVTARRGQYGGTVSALTAYALERGVIEAAVVAGDTGAAYPGPVVARTREEVLACAGSRYSAAPTLAGLHRAARDGAGAVGVVGRPCQVTALRKMQALGGGGRHPAAGKVGLVIGLFCFWSLSPDFYRFLADNVDVDLVTKVDIPVEGLVVTTRDGERRWPVEEIRRFIRPACLECFDPVAEMADLSVGSTECDPRWNTLVVRTAAGRQLVNEAVAAGVLEIKTYPPERVDILRRAVRNKKLRTLAAQEARGEAAYLRLPGEYRRRLKEEGES